MPRVGLETMSRGDDEKGEDEAHLQESSFDMTSTGAGEVFSVFVPFKKFRDPVANGFIPIHSGRSMSLS